MKDLYYLKVFPLRNFLAERNFHNEIQRDAPCQRTLPHYRLTISRRQSILLNSHTNRARKKNSEKHLSKLN